MTLQLETTEVQFESLWQNANRRAKNVKIDRLTLFRLLVDHGRLIKAAREAGIEVEDWPVIRRITS